MEGWPKDMWKQREGSGAKKVGPLSIAAHVSQDLTFTLLLKNVSKGW
jgi:hypothetical protein